MTEHIVDDALEANETLERSYPLRNGGTLGLTRDYLIVSEDDEPIRVGATDIVEVSLQSIDWFLIVMSVVIVGFGVLTASRSMLGAVAFVAIGVVNFYITYRKRGAIRITVKGRRKTLTVRPEEPREVYNGMKPLLAE